MSHCVDTYAQSCRNGYSAIFSVRQEEENAEGETDVISYATIEVYPRIRMIMQIRTYRNCRANNTIMSLIYEWARAKGLKLRGD